jgi:hypothetical protein
MAVTTVSKPAAQTKQVPPVPFLKASHEHVEAVQVAAISATPGANLVQSAQIPIPSYGYMRNIAVKVSTSGGTAGAGVLAGDAPWNVIQSIQIMDTNGSPITAPISGYALYLMNKYGFTAAASDPQIGTDNATASTNIVNFAFILRLPVEILRGLGSLPNQNSAAAYKMQITMNTSTNIYSTPPTTAPLVQFDLWLEAWSKPGAVTPSGRPQEVTPPRSGTTQRWWFSGGNPVVAGTSKVTVNQVGNLVRTIIFVVRSAAGVRQALANMPTPVELWWDNRQQFAIDTVLLRKYMAERIIPLGNAGYTGVENGVLVFDYSHDVMNTMASGTDLWLPTVQATRLELRANNWVVGSVDFMVNDVTPVATVATERYSEASATAFHPEVGSISPAQV